MSDDSVLVSNIVCYYNESDDIERCLDSLLNQKNIPGDFEILAIDGLSTDGTKEKILKKKEAHPEIIFFENPTRVKQQAVNLGFRESKGKYFVICDAHSYYDENYISVCLNIIKVHPEFWFVGGPIHSIGEGSYGIANAIAMSSKLGVGNAKHRFPKYEGLGEMACFPMFRKDIMNTVGYYDEYFKINHDDEYCFRVRKSRCKVYLTAKAKSYYYVRSTAKRAFTQYYCYGFWQIAFLKKHKIPISFRQLIPFSFFGLVIILLFVSLIINNIFIGIALPLVYISTIVLASIPVLLKNGVGVALNFPLAIFILHFSYASGFLMGILKFWKKKF